MIRRVIMSYVENSKSKPAARVVDTLSHFMRTNYGADAKSEALRHVIAYNESNQPELAEIWLSVAEALQSPPSPSAI